MATNTDIADDLETILAQLAAAGTTATTINFVAYLDDCEHHDWVHAASAKLSEKHPSRTIVLDATSEDCGVQTARGEDTGEPQVTVQGQRVVIGCEGVPAEAVRAAVDSLLVPGLPTVLWWTGAGLESAVFETLVDVAGALVVNSSGSSPDEKMVVGLAGFVAGRPNVSVRDIAWMRLRPWQDMIAQSFDDPTLREELFSIRRLQITAGCEAEALYLGGWFGSRLGWDACGPHEFCDRAGVRIPFEHVRAGKPRRITSIDVATVSSTYTAAVSAEDENVIMIHSTGPANRPQRMVALQAIDNATLLERAILEPAGDEIFESALRMVGSLLR